MPRRWLRMMNNTFANDSDHDDIGAAWNDATCQNAYQSPAGAELVGVTSWTDIGDMEEIFDPAVFPSDVGWQMLFNVALQTSRSHQRQFWIRIYDVDNAAELHRVYSLALQDLSPYEGLYRIYRNNRPGGGATPASKTRLRLQYQWKYWDVNDGYVAVPTSAYLHAVGVNVWWDED